MLCSGIVYKSSGLRRSSGVVGNLRWVLGVILGLCCVAGNVFAQASKAAPAKAPAAQPAAAPAATAAPAAQPGRPAGAAAEKGKPVGPPPPVELKGNDLVTSDYVNLSATYYGSIKGKEAVPLVLLHSWKGDRRDFGVLPAFLQSLGYAVLVPDLRGHGSSKQISDGVHNAEIDQGKMRRSDYEYMYTKDMEALRSFLVRENDAERLNLSKLGLIGIEMGASVAMHFAGYNNFVLPRPEAGKRPAPDVKALALISPKLGFSYLPLSAAEQTYRPMWGPVSFLILAGKGDSKSKNDAETLLGLLKRTHPEPDSDDEAATAKQTLFLAMMETKLQGAKLVTAKGVATAQSRSFGQVLARFLELRLLNKDYPWVKRGVDK
jgi:pimeloyl-ACP methyl ester carboxylesterase